MVYAARGRGRARQRRQSGECERLYCRLDRQDLLGIRCSRNTPMSQTIVDLSIYLENDVLSDPPGYRPKIDYIDHRMSVPELVSFFPGLTAADLPDAEGWAIERIQLNTHNGTHLDAP